jgi:hypothetical protein
MNNNLNNLKVHTWKEIIDDVPKPFNNYVFISMTESGKTEAIRELCYWLVRKKHHHNIILFSKTGFRKLNDDYAFIRDCPNAKVFDGSKKEIEASIELIQKTCKELKEKYGDEYGLIVIFDDIEITASMPLATELFYLGRHYNINLIVAAQNASYFLSPTVRTNIKYLCFRKVEPVYNKRLFQMCRTGMKFNDFVNFIDQNTDNYKFILYDNTSQSNNNADRIKLVKARRIKNMKIELQHHK